LPALAETFGVESAHAAWVIGFFIAPAVVLTPFLGAAADRIGVQKVVVSALILYGVRAGACYFASSFEGLLVLRLLQGTGAAALELLALVIISRVARAEDMRKAMGRNASEIGLCLCLYPVISGGLVYWNWRAVFLMGLVALPLAAVVLSRLSETALGPKGSPSQVSISALWRFARSSGNARQYFQIVLLFILLFGCFFSFVPVATQQAGITIGSLIGTIPLVMALAIAIVAPRIDTVAQMVGDRCVVIVSEALYGVSLLGC
jgi:MFS family permease